MKSSFKYLCLPALCLLLAGCGSTGRLLGNITMIPVKAAGSVARAATYKDNPGSRALDGMTYDIESAISHQLSDY